MVSTRCLISIIYYWFSGCTTCLGESVSALVWTQHSNNLKNNNANLIHKPRVKAEWDFALCWSQSSSGFSFSKHKCGVLFFGWVRMKTSVDLYLCFFWFLYITKMKVLSVWACPCNFWWEYSVIRETRCEFRHLLAWRTGAMWKNWLIDF